jgi:hypothetical protein
MTHPRCKQVARLRSSGTAVSRAVGATIERPQEPPITLTERGQRGTEGSNPSSSASESSGGHGFERRRNAPVGIAPWPHEIPRSLAGPAVDPSFTPSS